MTLGLLSAWAALWLALVPLVLRVYSSEMFVGGLTPDVVMQRSYFSWFYTHLGWDIIDGLFACVLLAFCLFLVGLVTLETLAWVARIDRDDRPVASLRWTVRAVPAVIVWSIIGLVVVSLLAAATRFSNSGSWVEWIPSVVGLAWFVTLPFFMLNARELERDRPALAWRPAWPGFQAVMVSILLAIWMVGSDWLTDSALAMGWMSVRVEVLVDSLLFVATLWPVSAFLYLWINRAGQAELRANARTVYAWRTIRELLSVDVRGIVLGAFVIGVPVVVTACLLIFFVPQIAAVNESTGQAFPRWVSAAIDGARFIAKWWWAFAPALSGLVLVARGRLYVNIVPYKRMADLA
jgi:hypothetical protein